MPVAPELMRLYAQYMHVEYGSLDSDYVFVNLWGGRVGRPLTYSTVNDVVVRTRRAVGFHFTPHCFRHTYATLSSSQWRAAGGDQPADHASVGSDDSGDLHALGC